MARRRVSAGAASTPIHQIGIQGRTTKALHGCSVVIKSSTSVVGPYAWVRSGGGRNKLSVQTIGRDTAATSKEEEPMAWSARARRGATGSRRRLGARKEEEAAALGTNPLLSFPLDAGGGRGADGRGGTDSTSRSPPRSEKGASRQWRQRRRSPRPRAAAPDRGGEPSVRGGCWRRRRHLRVAPDFFFVP
ncbi:hypothetical protein DAI22_08g114600 [Oryza sativa Japonica Group]|nr:uncharacterized protein LOC4345283 isoform X1 [Oryza sativa Japonica Group]KAF2919185.1 hypothetical protein DAI22_08g114600 [Oryza sativa Japonica Group]